MKKLLHICCNYAGPRIFAQLFAALGDLGLAQDVYVPEKNAEKQDRATSPHPLVGVVSSHIVRPYDRLLYYTKGRRAVLDLETRLPLGEYSLAHAHTLFTDGAVAYRESLRSGLPYVVSVRYTDLEYFYRYMPHLRGYALKILRAARAVHLLSPVYRDRLLAEYIPQGEREELRAKSVILPNGISPDWFTDTPKRYAPGDPVVVAFAGQLTRVKQPQIALEVLPHLRQLLPGVPVSLRIAGDGPLHARLSRHSEVLEGKAQLLGRLSTPQALRDFYDSSTLFLLPSTAETFGMVYLEAMARGLPVLYTAGQGFDGQFPPGEAGYPIPPRDPQAIAGAAMQALANYGALSAHNIRAARDFTWPRIASRFLELYNSL